MCQLRPVTEDLARTAAQLRGRLPRPGAVAATDAVVAALATSYPDAVVLTSDPRDLEALLDGHPARVAAV